MESFLTKIDARVLAGVPEGFDALVLAERARAAFRDGTLHVARDELRLSALAEAVAFGFVLGRLLLEVGLLGLLPRRFLTVFFRVRAARIASGYGARVMIAEEYRWTLAELARRGVRPL